MKIHLGLYRAKCLPRDPLNQETRCGLEQEHPHFVEIRIMQFYFDSIVLICLRSVGKTYCPQILFHSDIKPVLFSDTSFPVRLKYLQPKKKKVTNPQNTKPP